MKKTIPFSILLPVTDINMPAEHRHVGDMEVQANAYQYDDGSLLLDDDDVRPEVDVDALIWQGVNVSRLIDVVAPDFYHECKVAAAEHARQFETHTPVPEVFENGVEEAEDFAQQVDDHFEQQQMDV